MDDQEKRWVEQIRQLEDSFCNPRKLKEAEELREELKSRGYSDKEINCNQDD